MENWVLLEERENPLEETRRGVHLRRGGDRRERERWGLEREEKVREEQQRWSLMSADWGWLKREERGEREAMGHRKLVQNAMQRAFSGGWREERGERRDRAELLNPCSRIESHMHLGLDWAPV